MGVLKRVIWQAEAPAEGKHYAEADLYSVETMRVLQHRAHAARMSVESHASGPIADHWERHLE